MKAVERPGNLSAQAEYGIGVWAEDRARYQTTTSDIRVRMRGALVLAVLWGMPMLAQRSFQPTDCLSSIGAISFPPHAWGYAEKVSALAIVHVREDGTAELLNRPDHAAESRSSIPLEIGRSVTASIFERSCAGATLTFKYEFEFSGEKSETPETTVTKAGPNRVVVTARPPARLCGTPAGSDGDAEAKRGQADRLIDDHNFEEALLCVEASIAWKPLADAYISKGVALRKLHRLAEAVAAYDAAERLEPTNRYVHFDRANSYRDLGQLDRAVKDFTTAISINPRHVKAFDNRGNVYLRRGRFDLALQDYAAAIQIDPADFNAHNNRGLILEHLGEPVAALDEYQKAIELDPRNPAVFANRAGCLSFLQRYEEAIRDATVAITLDSDYFEARFNRAVAYGAAKQFQAAIDDLTDAIRLQPDSAEAYALRALARKGLGDAAGAQADQSMVERLGKPCPVKWFTRDPITGASIPISSPGAGK